MKRATIIEQVSFRTWRTLRKQDIVVGAHALDYLSNAEREVFDKNMLVRPLRQERPAFIGFQEDGRYAAYFDRKENYLKIIIAEKANRLEVVTFLKTRTLP